MKDGNLESMLTAIGSEGGIWEQRAKAQPQTSEKNATIFDQVHGAKKLRVRASNP